MLVCYIASLDNLDIYSVFSSYSIRWSRVTLAQTGCLLVSVWRVNRRCRLYAPPDFTVILFLGTTSRVTGPEESRASSTDSNSVIGYTVKDHAVCGQSMKLAWVKQVISPNFDQTKKQKTNSHQTSDSVSQLITNIYQDGHNNYMSSPLV